MNLDQLDSLRPTPLSAEIERRRSDPAPLRLVPDPPRVARRLTAGVVAVAVFALAAGLGIRALDEVPTPASPSDPWDSYASGWSELPAPPEWRDGASIVWTGTELVYWGGVPRGGNIEDPLASGFAFDPVSRAWSEIPAAPSTGAWNNAWSDVSLWTGEETLFLARGPDGLDGLEGQAFDPERGSWRSLPALNEIPRYGGAWAWTGAELIFVGGGSLGDPSNTAAWALDPATDTWRRLPDAPIPMNLSNAVWTGSELVVVGSAIDERNHATARTSQAQAYDPDADTWRQLPPPPVSAQTAAVAHVAGRLIAWEPYSPASAEWLEDEQRWLSHEMGGIQGMECYAVGATAEGALFTWNCGSPSAWFDSSSSWVPIARPLAPTTDITYNSAQVASAGSAIVVQEIETLEGPRGGSIIGSTDAPVHLWVWRAPASAPTFSWEPTAGDAENLAGRFLHHWSPGWELFLYTSATQDVIDRTANGVGGLVALEGYAVRDWRRVAAVEVGPGMFEVTIDLRREGLVIGTTVFTVGPGTAADGRVGQLVIIDARPA